MGLIFEVVLLTTNYFIDGFYKYFWGFYPKAGFLHPLYLLLLTVLVIRIFYLLFSNLGKKKGVSSTEYLQTKYILFAAIFYAIASSDFLVNYGVEFYPFGFLFILIFLGITAYAIVKHYLFGIKVILTELLVGTIALILLIQTLLAETLLWKILGFSLLGLFGISGYFLIKSVLKEIEYRDELKEAYGKVEKAYEIERKAHQELKKLDEAKNQFILITQHHLRTPLSIMKGYISMMLDGTYGEIGEKFKKPLFNFRKSTEDLIKLVNEFLDISQLQVGGEILNLRDVQIEDLLSEIVEELKPEAAAKKIYLEFEKPAQPLPQIKADPKKLKAALFNIVDNGIKYTEKGGVTVKVRSMNSEIKIEVEDTGMGMTKEEIDTLFSGFFKRSEEAKKVYATGRGIGLFLSDQIIKAHRGRVWAESEGKGKGSTFYIELPI
jgi:signal transduction histidine kinase